MKTIIHLCVVSIYIIFLAYSSSFENRLYSEFYADVDKVVQKFSVLTKNDTIKNYPINLADLHNGAAGMCSLVGSYGAITIDKEYYRKIKDNFAAVYLLLLHELNHCVLGRKSHINGSIRLGSGRCPKSISRDYTWSNSEIKRCYMPYQLEYQMALYFHLPVDIFVKIEYNTLRR